MDEKIVVAYYKYMVDIAVLFGADRDRATKELKDSLDFEAAIANVSWFPKRWSERFIESKQKWITVSDLVAARGTTKCYKTI